MRLDPSIVGPLRELGGDGLVLELFRTFVDHAPVRRENLRQAIETRDLAALESVVHSLRSGSAMLGAMELSEMAGRLEALAGEGKLDELLADLPALEAILEELIELLRGELGKGPASPASSVE